MDPADASSTPSNATTALDDLRNARFPYARRMLYGFLAFAALWLLFCLLLLIVVDSKSKDPGRLKLSTVGVFFTPLVGLVFGGFALGAQQAVFFGRLNTQFYDAFPVSDDQEKAFSTMESDERFATAWLALKRAQHPVLKKRYLKQIEERKAEREGAARKESETARAARSCAFCRESGNVWPRRGYVANAQIDQSTNLEGWGDLSVARSTCRKCGDKNAPYECRKCGGYLCKKCAK